MDSDDYGSSGTVENPVDSKGPSPDKKIGKGDVYDQWMKFHGPSGSKKGEDDDDDLDDVSGGSDDDVDDSDEVRPDPEIEKLKQKLLKEKLEKEQREKELQRKAKEPSHHSDSDEGRDLDMSGDDFELSTSMKKKNPEPVHKPDFDNNNFFKKTTEEEIDEDSIHEDAVDDFKEEDRDMLVSGSNQEIEFDHVEEDPDPELEKVNKEITEQLAQIPSRYDSNRDIYEHKPAAKKATVPKAVVRPTTAKRTERSRSKTKPSQPSDDDLKNQKRAASRVRARAEAEKRAKEEAKKAATAPRRKVDKEALKRNIETKKQKEKDKVVQSLNKLKNFKMPEKAPAFGGERGHVKQHDLEKQIEDDLMDLKIQLNTDDFGKRALEEDRRKEELKKSEQQSKDMFDMGKEEEEEEPEDKTPEDNEVKLPKKKKVVKKPKKEHPVPLALEKPKPVKVDPKKKAAEVKREKGFSTDAASQEAQRKQKNLEEAAKAKERHEEIKHQKMLRAKEEMARLEMMNQGTANYTKKLREEERKQKLTVGSFNPAILRNREKVPVQAQMVQDPEALKDELKDLMGQFKLLHEDHRQVTSNLFTGEAALEKASSKLNQVLKERKLVVVKGNIEKRVDPRRQQGDLHKMITQVEESIRQQSPLDSVVKKFAENGYNCEEMFRKLDANGDGCLTNREIEQGLDSLYIALSPDERELFMQSVDQNADGVITLDEWQKILIPQVESQIQYRTIMGDIDVQDPLSLEERCLDLEYRNRKLGQELQVLRQQAPSLKKQEESLMSKAQDVKRMAKKILKLESEEDKKAQEAKEREAEQEKRLRDRILARESVEDEHRRVMRAKTDQSQNYTQAMGSLRKQLLEQEKAFEDLCQQTVFLRQEQKEVQADIELERRRRANFVKEIAGEEDAILALFERVVKNSNVGVDMRIVQTFRLVDLKRYRSREGRLGELAWLISEHLAANMMQKVQRARRARKKLVEEMRAEEDKEEFGA